MEGTLVAEGEQDRGDAEEHQGTELGLPHDRREEGEEHGQSARVIAGDLPRVA
jgi:hypothetical protein